MEFALNVCSKQLNKEDLRRLVQSLRDCEMASFPNKEISIWIEAPDLSSAECQEILASIKPPYKYGPIIIGRNKGEKR